MESAKKSKITGPSAEGRKFTNEFIDFMNEACTPYHAIDAAKQMLVNAGFTGISEADSWNIRKGGKYYFTRNHTSIIAFTVGNQYEPGNGFTVAGAHSDSPCFRIKQVATSVKADALVLNTQPYGGGLWHTWFDR
jgi:aspartyl aminopeptidase